jgi:hypothetical protein
MFSTNRSTDTATGIELVLDIPVLIALEEVCPQLKTDDHT